MIFYVSHIIIESSSENIRLVKIGTTRMFDDFIHDKVVVSSPDINVQPIAHLNRFNTDGCAANYKAW